MSGRKFVVPVDDTEVGAETGGERVLWAPWRWIACAPSLGRARTPSPLAPRPSSRATHASPCRTGQAAATERQGFVLNPNHASTQGASKAVDWTLANLVKPEDELHLVHVIPVPMPEVVG